VFPKRALPMSSLAPPPVYLMPCIRVCCLPPSAFFPPNRQSRRGLPTLPVVIPAESISLLMLTLTKRKKEELLLPSLSLYPSSSTTDVTPSQKRERVRTFHWMKSVSLFSLFSCTPPPLPIILCSA